MKLTNDDVHEILQLLDAGAFDELHLQTLRFKLLLRRNDRGEWSQAGQVLSSPNVLPTADAVAATAPAAASAKTPAASAAGAEKGAPESDDLVPVRAPLLGTFYRAPKPGAPNFVEVGSRVEKDTVVGIVETMKMMNSVYAGVAGAVREICLKDAEFVEQDARVMLIEADPA